MVDIALALGGSDCERLRSGWLAQPANAVTSLVYVAVGLGLLWRSGRPAVRRGAVRAGALGLVAVGVGSIAYHGPQPGWAVLAHDGSIVGLALVIAGNIWVLSRSSVPAGPVYAAGRASAAWMAPALVAYVAGRSGSSLCRPASLLQPHAAWHVLSAVGLGLAVVASAVSSGGDRARP